MSKLSKVQKTKIQKWVDEALTLMRLNHWNVNIKFDDKLENKTAVAETGSDVTYHKATIYFGTEFAKEFKEGDNWVREICFHEVTHILLARIVSEAQSRFTMEVDLKAAHESTTEVIGKILSSFKPCKH